MALHSRVYKELLTKGTEEKRKRRWNQEIQGLERMRDRHQALILASVPVLIISFADLLSNEARTLERLNIFLPCADGISADFVARKGIEVFQKNKWKVRGSVHSYAQTKDPMDYSYEPVSSTCMNTSMYSLHPEYKEKLEKLEAYFQKHSL